jgi:hypothetical protein
MNSVDQSTALHAIKDLFRDYPRPYWVAGGWALDLFAQRTRRPHGDIDVLILARDLAFLAETFTSPRPVVQYAETGEQRPWVVGEQLEPGPHALVFPDDNRLCPIQILLAASDADQWVYHRGRGTIRRSLAEITLMSELGLPYLSPEIVLLFKSRSTRPKDNDDFADVESLLDGQHRQWLVDRIAPRYPDHPWLPVLRGGALVGSQGIGSLSAPRAKRGADNA